MTVSQFPPTLREVMLRGRWMGMLLLCLIVAGVFAWLGQWQLARAIDTDPPPPGVTETIRPIQDVIQPGQYIPEPLVGQKVDVTGSLVGGDFVIVTSRFNEGTEGFWVTGQLRVAERTSLAVALGWAPTRSAAEAAITRLEQTEVGVPLELTGRLISDEGPVPPRSGDPGDMARMSPAALLSIWDDPENLNVYRPYFASLHAPAGLVDIYSPAPAEISPVNWLNVFYAAEWAIFAGFACYLWYRLARDAWEREVEEFGERSIPK